MLTKGQKCKMFCIGLCALLLGAVVIIPFKSLFSCKNILAIEIAVKVFLIPVLMLLLSICPNKLKYVQVSGYRNQSRVVSVMSYFPVFIYLVSAMAETLYLISRGYVLNGGSPIGISPWNLWFVALILFIVAVITFFHFLPKLEMLLDVKEHVIFDVVVFVILVCIAALYFLVVRSTNDLFVAAGQTGDPFLLTLYIVSLIFIGIECAKVSHLIARDEVNLHVKFNDLDASSYVSRYAEYNRAYSDILDDFEEFFEESDEEVEELEEEQPVEEEAVEEQPAEEEAVEEQPVEKEAEEDNAQKEELAKLEAEVEEMRQQKEAQEAEEAQRALEREKAAQEALEKALKNKEEMRPTFAELVAYAKSLDQVSFVENKEKQQYRFLIGKKAFLVLTDTDKDYRLQFNVNPLKVVEWWTENTDIRPRTNKSDDWYKLTNKGSFTQELLFDIILHSHDYTIEKIAEAQAEKEAAREAKKAARKAEREQAKREAK